MGFTLVTSVSTSEKLVSAAWDMHIGLDAYHCAAYHLFNTVRCRYKKRSLRISPISYVAETELPQIIVPTQG